MAVSCVHHVQFAVKNGSRYVHKLISSVNFQLFAKRSDIHRTDWVLKSGNAVFVVSEHRDELFPETPAQLAGSDSLGLGDDGELNVASSDRHVHGKLMSKDNRTSSEIFKLGYISPPLSPHNLDLTLSKQVFGNIDTVCNVAFEVCDVEKTIAQALKGGAQVLCEPTVVKDPNGFVTVAAIKSCVGNVVHTILNTEHYDGTFLPGFSGVESAISDQCNHNEHANQFISESGTDNRDSIPRSAGHDPLISITHFDHVTFAVKTGSSNEVLEWYERCFGMRRFWLDRNEDKLEGFLVRGNNVGLRMKAMEYWRCAETGLVFSDSKEEQLKGGENKSPNMMFVVAEALPDQGSNQVETFIEQHGGPGVQHIGLYAPDIESTINCLKNKGLDFMVPPSTYYTEIGKLEEILLVGRDPDALQRLGILLDAEDFQEEEEEEERNEEMASSTPDANTIHTRYLMQVFTRPFFDRDTFFLEVIQRHGASGFGAGNIKALWRSVEAYMTCKEKSTKDAEAKQRILEY